MTSWKRLIDAVAALIAMLGCAFQFIITFYFNQLTKGESIELDKSILYIHASLMVLAICWLFRRAMNNWEVE